MLTILTPAYNRAEGVEALYRSLCSQTVKDFEWLMVDDGSTDDTRKIIEKMKDKADFKIRYIYKENGGKHTALNAGIKTIESELTFIVDSDDTVTDDAVETIFRYHSRYGSDEQLCGYAFLRKFPDGKINGKLFEPGEKIATYVEARINDDDTHADKAEVFYTRCLKEFPFPEYSGEKFLGEDIVWIRMAEKYRMVHINKAIYVGAYLEDGLTQNRRRHNIQSPIGCMQRAEEFLRPELNKKYRIKGALQYVIYGKFAGYGIVKLIKNSTYKKLVTVASLPGLLLYMKWKWEYMKG